MKKLVMVINGRGGVGKDTLCDFAAAYFRVRNVSSITPVKELAAQCGWAGEKTDRARKFLSDLKALLIAYNDYPTRWAAEQYRAFLAGEEEIMFLHIREGAEIAKFVAATGGRARTLLVRPGRRAADHGAAFGNASDDEVENYAYDYYYTNDLPLAEAGRSFVSFLADIYERDGADLTE